MIQHIKNRSNRLSSHLYYGEYNDFMLSNKKELFLSKNYLNENIIADFSDLSTSGKIYSSVLWKDAIAGDISLKDIGLTAMDNGFISFDKDKISNKEFLELYFNSEYNIESGDTRFFISPITGNTQRYEFPIENKDEYVSLKGGFYQGFYKLEGFKYQVLPSVLDNEICLSFKLRPRTDYTISNKNINYSHPENKGIFFYVGTRAENKFWLYYKTSSAITETFKRKTVKNDGYLADDSYLVKNSVIYEDSWLKEEKPEVMEDCPMKKSIVEEYVGEDAKIEPYSYSDSEGHELDKTGYKEIISDNKFLLFDQTKNGFTTKTWIEGTKVKLIDRQNYPNINYFPIMNQTETGYTVNNIDKYNKEQEKEYNIFKDIRNNAFCLRITDNGAIGYKYGVLDCEEENKYNIIEEYSKENIVKMDDWNSINIRFIPIGGDNMKILIYVNKNLILVSKTLPIFNFKALNDSVEKQECVPYNISLGGGTLGLLETILPDYYYISEYILPIEKDFCGSFIGDIKSFKIYNGPINYSLIRNYLS